MEGHIFTILLTNCFKKFYQIWILGEVQTFLRARLGALLLRSNRDLIHENVTIEVIGLVVL